MANYDKETPTVQANDYGFIRDTFEKTGKLIEILRIISNDIFLSKLLVLKGGTAINLTVFELPRLSFDLDFDFTENIDFQQVEEYRKEIFTTIRDYLEAVGYSYNTRGSRSSHALDSFVFHYISTSLTRDAIRIEINYLLRSHVFKFREQNTVNLGIFKSTSVLTLNTLEMFASKIVALLHRSQIRDLYDIYNLAKSELFDDVQLVQLRKCVVFYSAIAGDARIDVSILDIIDGLNHYDVKTGLYPTIRNAEKFDLEATKETVKEYLRALLVLTLEENEFLARFREREYCPELLFSNEMLKAVKYHPAAIWKTKKNYME